MNHSEEDYLQLSGLQHFKFRRRQWALAYIEQQWAENLRTTEGALLHERAHDEQLRERSRKPFGGAAVKLLSAVMRSGSVTLNYAAFRFVAWAGQAAPRFFTKLKHRK